MPKDEYVFPRGQAPGIELRDWFAGMALQGLVSRNWAKSNDHLIMSDYTELAYEMADSMIQERNKEQNQ